MNALNTPARTGHARAHSVEYEKDNHPHDRQDLSQSVILGSTPLPKKTIPRLGYVTSRGSAPPKSRPTSNLMDGCTISPATVWES